MATPTPPLLFSATALASAVVVIRFRPPAWILCGVPPPVVVSARSPDVADAYAWVIASSQVNASAAATGSELEPDSPVLALPSAVVGESWSGFFVRLSGFFELSAFSFAPPAPAFATVSTWWSESAAIVMVEPLIEPLPSTIASVVGRMNDSAMPAPEVASFVSAVSFTRTALSASIVTAPPASRLLAPETVVTALLHTSSVARAASALESELEESPSTLRSAIPPLPLSTVEREASRSVVAAWIVAPVVVTEADESAKSPAMVSSSSAAVSWDTASSRTAPVFALIEEPLSTMISAFEFGTTSTSESGATVEVAVIETEAASIEPSTVTDASAQCVPRFGASPFSSGTRQARMPELSPPETESAAVNVTSPVVVSEPFRMITSASAIRSVAPRLIVPLIVRMSRPSSPSIVSVVSPERMTVTVSIVGIPRNSPLTMTFVPSNVIERFSDGTLLPVTVTVAPDIVVGSRFE